MHKRQLHHLWTRLRHVSVLALFLMSILAAVTGLLALRNNNITALKLRDQVIAVDEQNGDVEAALKELRSYVHSHMNTDLSSGGNAIKQPVQLKYRYERLVRAEKDRVSKINEKVYTDAQNFCEQQIPSGTIAGRIPCVQDYVARNTVKEQPIPDALYKFSFQPPVWSPDLAGISLLLSVILFILFLIRLGLELWLRSHFRRHL